MHENEINTMIKAIEAARKAIDAINAMLAEKINAFNELAKELLELNYSDTETRKQAPFKLCMRIGTLRTYNGDTRKLWQKNKALYLCPYMPKAFRNKKQSIKEALL